MPRNQILEFSAELSKAAQHLNHYCENRQWDLRCQALPGRELADLKSWLPFVEAEAVALRLTVELSSQVLESFPRLPAVVKWLECTDVLLHEKNEWWPRLVAFESLRKMVVQQCPNLDISASSYVVGTGRAARIGVGALANLGFSRICLVGEDIEILKAEAQYLRRFVLGVHIEEVEAQTLTERKNSGSLLVNTLWHQDNGTVLGDLSYFNFMNHGGAVIDLSEVSVTNTLLEEAKQADLQALSGAQFQTQWDVDFLKSLRPEKYITFDDYYESLCDFLGK